MDSKKKRSLWKLFTHSNKGISLKEDSRTLIERRRSYWNWLQLRFIESSELITLPKTLKRVKKKVFFRHRRNSTWENISHVFFKVL